jgi:phosphoribosylglycinamide formyltransferase 1
VIGPVRPRADRRFAILISGRGSNMESLIRASRDGRLPADPAVVLADVADAPGLGIATGLGVPTAVVERAPGEGREAHDRRLGTALAPYNVQLICLAGYMRVLGREFAAAWHGRILNIHPSLLPAFPGLAAQRQAIEHGVRYSGCTVHLVDAEIDHGPIVAQSVVEVRGDDTPDTLAARILEQEHLLYPRAVELFFAGRLRLEGRRVRILPDRGA